MGTYYYGLISKLPLKGRLRVESLVIREFYVNTGRIIALLGVIYLVHDVTSAWLPWIIMIAALTQFGMLWLIKKDE